jgi:hypothetical protein
MISGRCDIDILNQFFLRLPESRDFAELDLSRDRDGEMKDVEKGDRKPGAGEDK